MKILRPILAAVIIMGLAPTFTGCVGYKLGTMLPDDLKTVYIPAAINKSREPLLDIETTRAVLEEVRKDGSLSVVNSPSEADSILQIIIRDYKLTPIVYRRTDRLRPDQMRFTLVATVKLTRANGEVIIFEPYLYGDALSDFGSDLTSAKRRALPDVAEDLAHDIVEKIVEFWPETPSSNRQQDVLLPGNLSPYTSSDRSPTPGNSGYSSQDNSSYSTQPSSNTDGRVRKTRPEDRQF